MNSIVTVAKALLFSLLLSASAFAADKVNINTADATAIADVLTGVGPAKAEAIIAYRKANGAFKSADQLAAVKGIGLKLVEKNRDRIVVSGAAPAAAPAKATAAN
jgi:competence protein ComEA